MALIVVLFPMKILETSDIMDQLWPLYLGQRQRWNWRGVAPFVAIDWPLSVAFIMAIAFKKFLWASICAILLVTPLWVTVLIVPRTVRGYP